MENKEILSETIAHQLDNLEDPVQRQITEAVTRKWEKSGLLEGLQGRGKRNMATLLENQLRNLREQGLLKESSQTSTTTGFEAWSNVALPLVRKVFANLLANEIVSVQPMNLPSGLVFYVDFQFGTAGNNSPTDRDGRTVGASVYGNTTNSIVSGGYYGGVNYSYTRNYISTSIAAAWSIATWADVDYEPSLSASFATGGPGAGSASFHKFTITKANWETAGGDATLVRAATLYTGTNINYVYRKWSKFDMPNNVLTFIVSGNTGLSAFTSVGASFIKKTTEGVRGDFEAGQGGAGTYPAAFNADIGIPELNLSVKSIPVVAQTRKLKAQWTPELQQDLSAYHDIDAEAELTTMLADQVSLEIDREILDNLLINGDSTNPFFWNRNLNSWVNSRTGASISAAVGGTFYGTQQDWYQTLIETLLEASNMVHKKTLRGAANFIVTSPEIATMLEATQTFRPALSLDEKEVKYSLGMEKVGTLAGRWTVYKDPYFQTNKILLGYKGNTFLENGFVYSPYVPLILTPTILDPVNFTPRKGIMTRYARTTVRPEFYASITVQGLRIPTFMP